MQELFSKVEGWGWGCRGCCAGGGVGGEQSQRSSRGRVGGAQCVPFPPKIHFKVLRTTALVDGLCYLSFHPGHLQSSPSHSKWWGQPPETRFPPDVPICERRMWKAGTEDEKTDVGQFLLRSSHFLPLRSEKQCRLSLDAADQEVFSFQSARALWLL